MKKFIILAASAALVLGACSKNEITVPESNDPVLFGVYSSNAISKATTGPINNAEDLQGSDGFGVFAFHTDNTTYSASATPNFMYNQPVTYSDAWTYSPIKYWPNEDNAHTNGGAGTDRVSFFAYAPFNEFTAHDNGIEAVSANTAAGDPVIKFTTPADANVDLLWAEQVGTSLKDLTKQSVNGTVNFTFKHALSRVGLAIQAFSDNTNHAISPAIDANTKIIVKSITLNTSAIPYKNLNLNNEGVNVPKWVAPAGDAVAKAYNLDLSTATAIAKTDATTSTTWANVSALTGVTTTETVLDAAYLIIPGSTVTSVQITYYTITHDERLSNETSNVENVITATLATPLELAGNTKYTIKLWLGMTTLKLTAEVVDWANNASATNIDLPANIAGV